MTVAGMLAGRQDSNLQHPEPKSDVLPVELRAIALSDGLTVPLRANRQRPCTW